MLNRHPVFLFLCVFGLSFLATYLITITFFVGLLGVDNAQTVLNPNFSDPSIIVLQKYMQCFMVFGIMIVPSFIYSYLISFATTTQHLGLVSCSFINIVFGFALMISVMPLVGYFAVINEQMQLPAFMFSIETKMKAMEELAKVQTEAFLKMNTIGQLVFNVIMIGALAAIGEELLFRGVIQNELQRRYTPAIAIVLSSFIFSFFHFQFYGFVPRLLLGAVLGIVFYKSGSLYISMFLHFMNNAIQVVLYYLQQHDLSTIDINQNPDVPAPLAIGSLLFTIGIVGIWQVKKAKNSV